MKKEIAAIKKKYKNCNNGINAHLELNELATVCDKLRKSGEIVLPEELPIISVDLQTEDGYNMRLSLNPVSMALHYGMYDVAKKILASMPISLSPNQFVGKLKKSIPEEDWEDEMDITIGQLIVSLTDIPKSFLKLYYKHAGYNPKRPPVRYDKDVLCNSYLHNFFENEFHHECSYGLLTEGLKAIQSKCPELFTRMMEKNSSVTTLPMIFLNCSQEECKELIVAYTGFLKTVFECIGNTATALEEFVLNFEGRLNVVRAEDFETYETAYRAYIEFLLSLKDKIMQSGSDRVCAKYMHDLMVNDAVLYIVWTNRHKVHEKSVRRAAKRIDAGVGECIHDIMGDDFIKYLKTHYVLWHGTEFDSFWNTLQMVTLFRYSYGYGMNLDMTDVNLTGFLSKRFEALKDCHNIDQEISSAIEILEIMGDFQNGEQLTDKNNSEAMKDIMDVARCIVETRNDELLEASLRKKLLPICIYKELMEQARDKAPSLIPCLIAYRQAV